MAKKQKAEEGELSKLEQFELEFKKLFGKDSINSGIEVYNYDVVPFDCITLDAALGINGLPYGRMVEIYGAESSGKTTLFSEILASEQRKNPDSLCAYLDMEQSLDLNYFKKLGVDFTRVKVSKPMTGEEGFNMAMKYANSGLFKVIVFDSFAAAVPTVETENDIEKHTMGVQARMIGKALRALNPIISKNNVLFLIVNQTRDKIGVMFGDPSSPTGGNAPKFFASIRLEISRSTTEKNSFNDENGEKLSNLTKVKVVKNKCAPPFKKAEFYITYNEGIDRYIEVYQLGSEYEIIKRVAGKDYYGDILLGKSMEEFKKFAKKNNDIFIKLKEEVKKEYNDENNDFEPTVEELLENEGTETTI